MCGPLFTINSPLCPLEDLRNVVSLQIAKIHGRDAMLLGRGVDEWKQHFLYGHSGGMGENDGSFDDVLQFAHVPRPVVGQQAGH